MSCDRMLLAASYWCVISMRPSVRALTARAKRASASPWIDVAGYSLAMFQRIVWAWATPAVGSSRASVGTRTGRVVMRGFYVTGVSTQAARGERAKTRYALRFLLNQPTQRFQASSAAALL